MKLLFLLGLAGALTISIMSQKKLLKTIKEIDLPEPPTNGEMIDGQWTGTAENPIGSGGLLPYRTK